MYYIIYNVWGGKYFIEYVLPINIAKIHGHLSSILSDLHHISLNWMHHILFMFPTNEHLSLSTMLHSFRQCYRKLFCVHKVAPNELFV